MKDKYTLKEIISNTKSTDPELKELYEADLAIAKGLRLLTLTGTKNQLLTVINIIREMGVLTNFYDRAVAVYDTLGKNLGLAEQAFDKIESVDADLEDEPAEPTYDA